MLIFFFLFGVNSNVKGVWLHISSVRVATKMVVMPSPFKYVLLGMLLFREIDGATLERGHEGLTKSRHRLIFMH